MASYTQLYLVFDTVLILGSSLTKGKDLKRQMSSLKTCHHCNRYINNIQCTVYVCQVTFPSRGGDGGAVIASKIHCKKASQFSLFCRSIQPTDRGTGEYLFSISQQGTDFISAVLLLDLKSKIEEIKRRYADCPSLMAYADYTTYPASVKFMDSRSFVPDDEVSCSTPRVLEWDRAVADTGYKEGNGKFLCHVIIPKNQGSQIAMLRVMDIATQSLS